MEAGGEADGGGDAAFGDFAGEQGGGSAKADEGGESGGSESEVKGSASLADALAEDTFFNVIV